MKKVVITVQMIRKFPHKSSKHRPGRPYCRLCSCFDRRVWRRGAPFSGTFTKYHVHIFEPGETAIMIKFRNGTISYYEPKCWNDPQYAERVKNILKQEYQKPD